MTDYSEKTTVSDKELLHMYYKFYLSLGRTPTPKDLNSSNEIYNADIFLCRFQTMSNLRRLSGVPLIKKDTSDLTSITKEEVKEDLVSIYKNFGRIHNRRLLELSEYNVATICYHFEKASLKSVWDIIEKELKNSDEN